MNTVENVYKLPLNPRRCKSRMQDLGLTYESLAEEMTRVGQQSVSRAYVSHLVNGQRKAYHLWPVLAEALQCSIEDLTNQNVRAFTCCKKHAA